MKKTIILCDKCGSHIEEQDDLNINGMDFCPKCTSKLFLVIQKWAASAIVDKNEEHVAETTEEVTEEIAEAPVEMPTAEPAEPVEDFLAEEKYPAKKKKKSVDKKENTEQEEPKRKIDWDKACALKKAGWSNKEIAEECKIKLSTLSVDIYRHLKLYDERKAREEALAKQKILEV